MADRNPAPQGLTRVAQPAADRGTRTRPEPPAAGRLVEVSATVAGFDGAVIGSVARQREADPTDAALSQEVIVVSVTGDLDADTGPLLHLALTEALDAHPRVCCDLSRVAFCGAAGANAVLAAHRRATAAGRHFTVRGVHGITELVLAVTGLDEMLTITG